MDYECVIFVLKRCNNLLERKNGTAAVKNEYRGWLSYLEKQLRFYKKLDSQHKENIKKLIISNRNLKQDVNLFLTQ